MGDELFEEALAVVGSPSGLRVLHGLAARRDRERQRADRRLHRELAADGFGGPRFELVAAELACYALPLVLAALYAGRLPGPRSARLAAAECEETAYLAVARAVARLRAKGLPVGDRPGRPARPPGRPFRKATRKSSTRKSTRTASGTPSRTATRAVTGAAAAKAARTALGRAMSAAPVGANARTATAARRPARQAGLKAGFLRWVEHEVRVVLRRPGGVDPEHRALFHGFGVWESSPGDPFANERLQTVGRERLVELLAPLDHDRAGAVLARVQGWSSAEIGEQLAVSSKVRLPFGRPAGRRSGVLRDRCTGLPTDAEDTDLRERHQRLIASTRSAVAALTRALPDARYEHEIQRWAELLCLVRLRLELADGQEIATGDGLGEVLQFLELLEASSLGTPGALALRRRTGPAALGRMAMLAPAHGWSGIATDEPGRAELCGWAELVLSLPGEQLLLLPVEFSYSAADPHFVRSTFHFEPGSHPVWELPREVLLEGLQRPAGLLAVKARPEVYAGRAVVHVLLQGPDGHCVLLVPRAFLELFLERSLALAPAGTEHAALDVDALLRSSADEI
ncbi:SsgA family sporulation/cell division regulator [Kitasatospora sp. NPDC049285]|uniref:SsgA family sporulation/cell division regulator n=1 Tax=Kitasatospora sp. NPDC049285 TaxID=3157096 RepID=UPI0034176A7A